MAWNEPGNNNNGGNEGPPEIEKIIKDMRDRISKMFGKKPSTAGAKISAPKVPFGYLGFGLIVVIIIWALSGIFIVSPAEKAVILQFGRYDATVGPGPHWIARFFQTEQTVNVQKISTYSYGAQMLTKDQNIVDVSVAVQYKIDDMRNYLFNVSNPDMSLQQATASALRQVIGNTTLDQVLTTGRAEVRQAVVVQLEKILAIYNTGIEVTDVSLQPAQAPAEVKASFDDAIKAQEDEQRYQNQAQAYANGVVPIAQGKAKRIIQEAQAYQQQVVLRAQGDVASFDAIYAVYQKSPQVTRERLYLTTLESVLARANKVFIDTKGHNNMVYVPLDKLVQNSGANPTPAASMAANDNNDDDNNASDNSSAVTSYNADTNPDSLVGVRGARP